MTDFTCDLNCPVRLEVTCCKHCALSKKMYKDENESLWSDTNGFWTPNGCALPREQMPQECREYDCRDYLWVVIRKWDGNEWRDLEAYQVQPGYKPIGIQSVKEE